MNNTQLKDISISTYMMDSEQTSVFVSCWTDIDFNNQSTHPVQNKTVTDAITNIRNRLNNIEVLLDPMWKQTTLKIENVDSIDKTQVKSFNLM